MAEQLWKSLVLDPDGFQLPSNESDFKESRVHSECYKSLCFLNKSFTNITTLQKMSTFLETLMTRTIICVKNHIRKKIKFNLNHRVTFNDYFKRQSHCLVKWLI